MFIYNLSFRLFYNTVQIGLFELLDIFMINHYSLMTELPVSKQKPLVLAIRYLIAGGFALGVSAVKAESLPLPSAGPVTSNIAVNISPGQATAQLSDAHTMQIHQSVDKAIIDWKSFDIDKGYKVNFNQSANQIALNNIHQADASKILGSLTAGGQVYLINQNGFLFGKDSQVNVNSLVASTLGVSDTDFQKGITKIFDQTQTAALQGNGEVFVKDAHGNVLKDQNGNKVKIQIFVEEGASIKTKDAGGRVILAAPSITNKGNIETPDGQTILAASTDKVYLQEANGDPNIRGLLVEVGTGGEVNNVGKVLAERGNASLLGFAVNQQGVVSASTSVQLNGSVRLLAHEGIQDPLSTSGKLVAKSTKRSTDLGDGLGVNATVTLASGSVTSVELDADKTKTAIDAQVQSHSNIQVSGHNVDLKPDSLIQAHSGQVNIEALDDPALPLVKGDASVNLRAGSKIDVSGLKNLQLPADRNIIKVELRKNELRDSPLQRTGVLYGQTVSVDLRDVKQTFAADGSLLTATIPIADVKGAVDRIARNIDERSTSAGAVNINSSGGVTTNLNSTVDISGGSVKYQAGNIGTTKLISNGQLFDIATADPNRHYDQIILAKDSQYYSPGYIDGKAGGTLDIASYAALLDGVINGQVVTGLNQRLASEQPSGSSLLIDLNRENNIAKQDVIIDQDKADHALVATSSSPLHLNAKTLSASGIQNITLKTNGSITLTKATALNLPAFSKLDLFAQNFDIQGAITSPSGTLNFLPITQRDGDKETSLPSAITLGAKAFLDVSGVWINDRLDNANDRGLKTISIQGGSVNLKAEQADINITKGSTISTDGGAWYQNKGDITAGEGGKIQLTTQSNDLTVHKGSISLEGNLHATALNNNGSLKLETNEIVIGNNSDLSVRPNSDFSPLALSENLFKTGGFSSYDLTANYYGLKVADNTHVLLKQVNEQLDSTAILVKSGAKISDISQSYNLADGVRNTTSLKLNFAELTGQNKQEALIIGKGALIQADMNGHVTLNSDTAIFVDGQINTPSGKIALTVTQPKVDLGYFDSQAIWLGANSQLLAQGTFKAQPNAYGLVKGDVLAGGDVSITANRGYIVSSSGSKIDVSGAIKKLDFIENSRIGSYAVASDAGSISLAAGEGLLLDGEFKAIKGGIHAAGGSLTVNLDRGLRGKGLNGGFPDDSGVGTARTLQVFSDNADLVPQGLTAGDAINANNYSGVGKIHSQLINSAGFDSINLSTDAAPIKGNFNSRIEFKGDVQLGAAQQIVLNTPSITAADSKVSLNTAYVALGSTKVRNNAGGLPLAPAASSGASQFSVQAKGIDLVGGLSFNGFGLVNLVSDGDVRLRGLTDVNGAKDFLGQLNIASDLKITSNQLYPATLTDYTIRQDGAADNTVTFSGNDSKQDPVYSAGGRLTVSAQNIIQQGVLKAPFGELVLNAEKNLELAKASVTSVAGNNLTIPFGVGSGGTSWLYPLNSTGSKNIVVNTPPEKRLELNGKHLNLQSGSTIDLSGGGDLYAYEFITGAGGSNDVLDNTVATNPQSFAVLPSFNAVLTPYDPMLSANAGLSNGQSVYLDSGAGLVAGWYTLLPAHYALLPGAYLITPKSGTQDQFQTTHDIAGTAIVSGRYGVTGTDVQSARSQGFAVELGSVARTRSEYTNYFANQFFNDQAIKQGTALPQLPQDAGSLVLDAKNSLTIEATLLANPVAKGLGGQVDISADQLEVVGKSADLASLATGTVGLLVDDLNKLNSPSLLLGGKRTKESQGERVTVTSQNLKIAGNVDLKGQEILLAATDDLLISAGATLESSGKTNVSTADLLVSNLSATSDAALLRISDANQVAVLRDQPLTAIGGTLTVETGATLKADGSMLLDSSKDTVFDGSIVMDKGSLALNSSSITLGNAPAGTSGLVLKDSNFNVDELRLSSASDINIYGAARINATRLFLSAASLNGFANAGQTPSISADLINLSNHGAVSHSVGNGTGSLILEAHDIQLGSGQYGINGFNQVTLRATDKPLETALASIQGLGQVIDPVSGNSSIAPVGSLSVAGDLTLDASYFSGGSGATTRIDATGYHVEINSANLDSSYKDKIINKGLGVSWSVLADSINSNARFDVPSGKLVIEALKGDLNLNNGSKVDLSGQVFAFNDRYKATSAGSLFLMADQGNINLDSATSVNLAGASVNAKQVSDAGELIVKASNGELTWNGVIDAKGFAVTANDFLQGRFSLDVNNLGPEAFSGLNTKLANAGFTEAVSIEQRMGDVTIAENAHVNAHNFELGADQGSVMVAGSIDASGLTAGHISIYGRNGVRVSNTGALYAKATTVGNNGGSILLDTVHHDDFSSGILDLSALGGQIDVSSGQGGIGGFVHLRMGRDQIGFKDINTTIVGADPIKTVLEATSVVKPTDSSNITTADIDAWKNTTATFMAAKPTFNNQSGANLVLLPGIEVRSDGDLNLQNKWDFMTGAWSTQNLLWNSEWRYADSSGSYSLPGFLTLRSAGDININASLTDALATTPIIGQVANLRSQDMLQPGQSWSYNLISGGAVNLAAAYLGSNPLVANGQTNQQVVVRTGTGAINIKAAKDIVLNKDDSNTDSSNNAGAIYTVGTSALYNRSQLIAGLIPGIPGLQAGQAFSEYLASLDPKQTSQLLRYGLLDDTKVGGSSRAGNYLFAEYPVNGGDISLAAGGNIQGAQTGQQMSDWLVRAGVWNANTHRPTAWGINISGDQSSAGAGRVAGNTVYAKGTRNFNENIGALGGGDVTVTASGNITDLSVMIPTTGKPMGLMSAPNVWTQNGTVINGGGNVKVSAQGDVVGGEFYTGQGVGVITAGNSITQSTTNPDAFAGVILDVGDAKFDMQARLDVVLATAMNPTLLKQTILPDKGSRADSRFVTYGEDSAVNLQATAGNVVFQNDINAINTLKNLQFDANDSGFQETLYPGIVKAIAFSGDVELNGAMSLYPSVDGQLELLANRNVVSNSGSVFMSDADPAKFPSALLPTSFLEGDGLFLYNYLNPFQADTSLIHATTPLHKNNKNKPLIMARLGDIGSKSSQVNFNLPESASFVAGHDINNLDLAVQNISATDTTLVQAGGSINYSAAMDDNGIVVADDKKIQVSGPGQLNLIAGKDINLGSSAGIQTVGNLLNTVLDANGASINVLSGASVDQIDIAGFVAKYQSNAEYTDLLNTGYLTDVLTVLFSEISKSASAAAVAPENKRAVLYQRGTDAIDALFPPKNLYKGDLALVYSQIKSIASGNINLLVPGGKVDVGLAGKQGGVSKNADQLGIVVQSKGDLNILAKNDVNVNQSRVFTLGGGNINAWSSKGSIDAGKGAKSALSAPAPVTLIDDKGNVKTVFPPIISGSGIQAIGGGDVTLAAPNGVVDAGEAGISGGHVTIAATAVIGASNISSSGGTVGVPTTVSAPVSLAGANSAAASATKNATQSADDDNKNNNGSESAAKKKVSIISADIVGFGDCSVADVKEGKNGCGA